MAKRFVLLDRDGTINEERHYLDDPDELRLLPNAACGLRSLREQGLGLILITNQSAVGRGYFGLDRLAEIHRRLHELLGREGAKLDAVYVCPHSPWDGCDCRKPNTGLALQAQRDFGFEPAECLVIGDKACDITMGRRLGATTFLVRTGYGVRREGRLDMGPHFVVNDLLDAARTIERIVGPRGSRAGRPAGNL